MGGSLTAATAGLTEGFSLPVIKYARNTAHHRVANLRRDGLRRLTTGLAATISTVAVEDLNMAGMLHNRRSARGIAGTGFGGQILPVDADPKNVTLTTVASCLTAIQM